jgi:(1->4)-alpha-D-glucan 1-alpha-D-glucosylmutase
VSGSNLGSTYRLQLNGFGLAGAAALVPYLDDLGVETLYLSPILAATPGSTHGYDVIDPTRIDPALGSEEDLDALLNSLSARGMRALLDIVPNHMAVDPANAWWWDVLRRGQDSPAADVFDIDWRRYDGTVVVPTLGRPLQEVMADGACAREGDTLRVDGQPFPVAPETSAAAALEALAEQHYRPAYWRSGETQGNYRRFFDIGTLIGVRVEDPEVFTRTHRRILAIAAHPAVAGLRVDHVDGLADPRAYLVRLRDGLDRVGSAALVFVEKILAYDESLDPHWPVEGTTGYEFGDRVLGLFLDPVGCARLLEFGARPAQGADTSFAVLSEQAKREVIDESFSGDLDRLARITQGALDLEARGHDLSVRDLRRAWSHLTVHLSVYRTYIEGGVPSTPDRARLLAASKAATALDAPGTEVRRALERITKVLTGEMSPESPWFEVARRWQQLSGAVMAKGSEDTATYRWAGLPVQADVGGNPDRVEDATRSFHRLASSRMGSMNATSTHDSKRSEDARCRLAVLSEAADEWVSLATSWHRLCAAGDAVQLLDELRTYASLFALWPATADGPDDDMAGRVQRYVIKAAREAKQRTSWTDPDLEYEDVAAAFVDTVMACPDFRASMTRFCQLTAGAALSNVLGLVVLKSWAPGVPDFYQGTELMEPTLTDPDNRRPVDFAARAALLASLGDPTPEEAVELLSSWPDGRLKLQVTRLLLRERRRQPELFRSGSYEPVEATTGHAVAFLRRSEDRCVLAVVPRLVYGLAGPARHPVGGDVWGDARVTLPRGAPQRYRDLLTGRMVQADSGRLRLGDLLESLPVAALVTDA